MAIFNSYVSLPEGKWKWSGFMVFLSGTNKINKLKELQSCSKSFSIALGR